MPMASSDSCTTRKRLMVRSKMNRKRKSLSLPSMTQLPSELVVKIMTHAAATSREDLFNIKLSCKVFRELSEEGCIYRHVSLDNFPVIPWDFRASFFLDRCINNGNPEALFRQGLVELFSSERIISTSGLEYLRAAMDAGHLGASYLLGMISVFSGEEEQVKQGLQLLTWICSIDRAKECREKLSLAKNGDIWLIHNNWTAFLKGRKPVFCSKQHLNRIGWSSEYEYFEDESCKACKCDAEVSSFYDRFCRNNL